MEFLSRPGDHLPDLDEIAALGERPGSARLTAQVHRLRFRLDGLDEELLAAAAQVFENFTDRDFPGADREIAVNFALSPRETFLAFRATPEPERYRILASRFGEDFRFVSYHFAAHYRPRWRTAKVALARGPGRHRERLVDNFFRVLAGYAFIEEDTVLVHAAALARGGRGYLFLGPSGSGKTTAARLSLTGEVSTDLLSDDQGLLSVEGGEVLLSGTPFRGGERLHANRHPDAIPGPNANRTVPLAGLYRLVQSPEVRLENLPRARQITDLLSAVPVFPGEPYNNERLLATLDRVVDRVPLCRLHFRRDDSFWALLAG